MLGNTGKLTAAALAQFDSANNALKGSQSVAESKTSISSIVRKRPKGETSEERKERKQLLKDYRKVRNSTKYSTTQSIKFYIFK